MMMHTKIASTVFVVCVAAANALPVALNGSLPQAGESLPVFPPEINGYQLVQPASAGGSACFDHAEVCISEGLCGDQPCDPTATAMTLEKCAHLCTTLSVPWSKPPHKMIEGCNLFNFQPAEYAKGRPANRCCLRSCPSDFGPNGVPVEKPITDKYGGWDIYQKGGDSPASAIDSCGFPTKGDKVLGPSYQAFEWYNLEPKHPVHVPHPGTGAPVTQMRSRAFEETGRPTDCCSACGDPGRLSSCEGFVVEVTQEGSLATCFFQDIPGEVRKNTLWPTTPAPQIVPNLNVPKSAVFIKSQVAPLAVNPNGKPLPDPANFPGCTKPGFFCSEFDECCPGSSCNGGPGQLGLTSTTCQ